MDSGPDPAAPVSPRPSSPLSAAPLSPAVPPTLASPATSSLTAGRLALEVAGWSGTVLLLLAFVLNTTEALSSHSVLYLVMNAAGSAGVGANALAKRTWPAFAIEAAWCLIALVGLVLQLAGMDHR